MPLTAKEKNAIRDSMCSLCLAMPPFPDGSRCHVHRIVRGKDGGQYVAENVIPLCPSCHREIDGLVLILAAHRGGVISANTTGGWRRAWELHPELFREIGRRTATERWAKMAPNERGAHMNKMYASQTPAERIAAGYRGYLNGLAKATPEQRRRWSACGLTARQAALANVTHEQRMDWTAPGRKAIAQSHSRKEWIQRAVRASHSLEANAKRVTSIRARHQSHGLTEKELARNRAGGAATAAKWKGLW